MTRVQHTKRVTRVQHRKSDSCAVSPLSCSTQILLACSAQNIARVRPIASHMSYTCVTQQKLKNTHVFSICKCQLRNELYRIKIFYYFVYLLSLIFFTFLIVFYLRYPFITLQLRRSNHM